LQTNTAPWIHLYEDGGLESSSLAKQLGVQTLPMMLLIDADGKVVSNNIYAAGLDAELAKIARPAATRPTAPAAAPQRPATAKPQARPAAGSPAGSPNPSRPGIGGAPTRPAANRAR
jgi:hypothetical protein